MADLVIRPSIKGVLFWYFLSTLLFLAIIALMAWRDWKPVELWALAVIPLGIDVWASMKHVRLNACRLTIADGLIRLEDGIVTKSRRDIVLDKIRDVRVDQSLGQRLIGIGDLSVEAIGESGSITLNNVDQPRQGADAILNAMRDARRSNR